MANCKLIGYGYYAPDRVMPNSDLEKIMDTSDEWIKSRTGIRQRYVARPDESVEDMAASASVRALERAGITANDIDCVIMATISNKRDFPASATYLYAALGMTNNAPAFDVKAACTGFVYAMHIANAFFKAGMYKRILIVGSEKMTDMIDWTDRNTAVLFGDGAGAMIFEASETETGIIATDIGSNGHQADLLYSSADGRVMMNGVEVYKHAVREMTHIGCAVLRAAGLENRDIDWLLPHQANMRIMTSVADKLGFGMDRVIANVGEFANTSGASGAIALAQALENGQILPGQKILYTAFGAGLTWGAAVIKI